jgi:hypothetical protein
MGTYRLASLHCFVLADWHSFSLEDLILAAVPLLVGGQGMQNSDIWFLLF